MADETECLSNAVSPFFVFPKYLFDICFSSIYKYHQLLEATSSARTSRPDWLHFLVGLLRLGAEFVVLTEDSSKKNNQGNDTSNATYKKEAPEACQS